MLYNSIYRQNNIHNLTNILMTVGEYKHTMSNSNTKLWFTAKLVIQAVKYHLIDEGWFKLIPEPLEDFLNSRIEPNGYWGINNDEWADQVDGNERIVYILYIIDIDPIELCKFHEDPKRMEAEFNRIVDIWSNEAKIEKNSDEDCDE